MTQSKRITKVINRPGMFSDDAIQSSVSMETNEITYAEVITQDDNTVMLRHLERTPNKENIRIDSPVFDENTTTAAIPIRHFNHMPTLNELLVLESYANLEIADVTRIDMHTGTIHVEQRVHSATHSQRQKSLELQKTLLREYRAYTVNQIAVLQNTTPEEAQAYLNEKTQENMVFTVDNHGITLYPAFLFNEQGRVEETIGKLVQVFEGEFTGWSAWAWFCYPTGMLSGNVPADMAYQDFDRALIAVHHMYNELFNPYY